MSNIDEFLRTYRLTDWEHRESPSFSLYVGRCALGEIPGYRENIKVYYISEDGFLIFNNTLRRHFLRFDWYGDTCLSPTECTKLETALIELATGLNKANSVQELNALFEMKTCDFESVSFAILKSRLKLLVEDFLSLAHEAARRRQDLWISGI